MAFILGVGTGILLYVVDERLRETMKKIHKNDPAETARLKIPGYSIYSWIRFKKEVQDSEKP